MEKRGNLYHTLNMTRSRICLRIYYIKMSGIKWWMKNLLNNMMT